jgi:hypothetical protein
MKWTLWLTAIMALLVTDSRLGAQRVSQTPVIDIQRETVIAFYPAASQKDKANADANEALSDFQFYAGRMKQPLSRLGIDFQELYVRSFRIRRDRETIVFRPKTDGVGYYFIAPGKKPHIEYGVMTDADLLLVARRYFGPLANHK